MKGYIYTMFDGADPGQGWRMTDPIIDGKRPTMGACMPNIRRNVVPGDYIFVVSGNCPGVQQYVVGGFEVDRKIDALAAYHEFPGNRQVQLKDGSLKGNIICDADGNQNPYDYHKNFERRLENYIVGRNPKAFEGHDEISLAREQTLSFLCDLFDRDLRNIKNVRDVLARWRKLDKDKIEKILNWMDDIKKDNSGKRL